VPQYFRLVSLIPVVHLHLRISPRIKKKIEITLMLFSGAWGKMIMKKTWSEEQSRDTVPWKYYILYSVNCKIQHNQPPGWPLCQCLSLIFHDHDKTAWSSHACSYTREGGGKNPSWYFNSCHKPVTIQSISTLRDSLSRLGLSARFQRIIKGLSI
jgi:hypothetical protein